MYITADRAAKLIGRKRNAVYQMVKKGTIPYERQVVFGGRSAYRIPLGQFSEWIEREMFGLKEQLKKLEISHKRIQEVLKNGRSA